MMRSIFAAKNEKNSDPQDPLLKIVGIVDELNIERSKRLRIYSFSPVHFRALIESG
jgi:hypothetical protein